MNVLFSKWGYLKLNTCFHIFYRFWQEHPLLYFGLSLYIGAFAKLSKNPYLSLILFPLFIPFFKKRDIFLLICIATFTVGYFYTSYRCYDSSNIHTPIKGTATFTISSLKKSNFFFTTKWIYEGILKNFKEENKKKSYPPLLCKIYQKEKSLKCNTSYHIEGWLNCKNRYFFTFKPQINKFTPYKKTYNLLNVREKAKNKVRSYLRKNIQNRSSCNFLSALIAGNLDENFLKFSFGRCGLLHILAISGFHFSFIILCFSFLLKWWLPPRKEVILLIIVNLYLLFLGISPSILRAAIMIELALLGQILGKRYFPLNALGLALIVEVAINPLHILSIGFQLSFLCTAFIVQGYPIFNKILSKILKIRTPEELQNFSLIAKGGYKISAFIRQTLALSCAVNLATLPLILLHFHKFPLLSFIYNLFFPFLVSISLFLLILSFLIFPLSPPIHLFNSYFTYFILEIATHPPTNIEFYLRTTHISSSLLILYLCTIFPLMILGKYLIKEDVKWAFI